MPKPGEEKTIEEYYAEHRKLGMIDSRTPAHVGEPCRCGYGQLLFVRQQIGPFGNSEAVYRCSLCQEELVYAIEDTEEGR